jgi:hypothetical protein
MIDTVSQPQSNIPSPAAGEGRHPLADGGKLEGGLLPPPNSLPQGHHADTREAWLLRAIEAIRPWFAEAGSPLPAKLHVSIGFTGGGKNAIGSCWSRHLSADHCHQVFISPVHETDFAMLDTLVHELVHAALPFGAKHGALFRELGTKIGLRKPWRSAGAGPALARRLEALAIDLGPSRHPTLSPALKEVAERNPQRTYQCACGVKATAARGEFEATCRKCGRPFLERKSPRRRAAPAIPT